MPDVLCLRPEADFLRVGVTPPKTLAITYMEADDPAMPEALAASDALVIAAVGPRLDADLFKGGRVRLVQVTGAGVDRVDVEALRSRAIQVANVPGGSNEALAEYCVSCAAVLSRRFWEATAAIRAGDYAAFRSTMLADGIEGLVGRKVGVVGAGTIGTAVAARFRQAGAHILYYDPAPRDVAALNAIGAERSDLDALLAEADVVTLHVPLNEATTGLMSARRLALMRPTAILIQASRGGIVDEAALASAIETNALGGAAVDVYTDEPPPLDHPLLTLSAAAASRLILTPHVAGVTRQSWATLFRTAWENVLRATLTGEAPRFVM